MAKTRQVLKLNACGKKYSIVLQIGVKDNPFWIYEHRFVFDPILSERKRRVAKYQTMDSCLSYLAHIPAFAKEVC